MKEEELRRNQTGEFKLECCRQVATGQKRPAQVCREHNLAQSMLLRWRNEYEGLGEAAFTEKQLSQTSALEQKIAELERFCGRLSALLDGDLEEVHLRLLAGAVGERDEHLLAS